ncbi:lauroyl acyltransferase [Amaricoccus sp.]|uniref:lysophospholipid acyltransferase family protein n=1 Tax=Amaricoccus sp. TaxID=1872485 RepID=UPI001B6810F9|nr:lauroyl acyltransferase [Amaricoccus sp.]MBP7240412.1 lauroyl acyltransferase [Amaricoccus sp.]
MSRRGRPLAEALAFAPAALSLGLVRALPWRARLGFGGWLGRRIVLGLPKLRGRVDANLRYVMPELDAKERRAIAAEVGDSFGRTFVETFCMADFQAARAWIAPTGPGAEAVAAAAREGRPAIVVSGHLGQWEAGRAWAKATHREAAAVYRPLNNRWLEPIYRRQLEIGGRPMLPKGAAGLRGLVAHLRSGGLAAILVDQYDRRAPRLDFLGRPAPTVTLAADLALKFGAPLIPGCGIRQPDGVSIAIQLDPPVPHTTPAEMMQVVNDSLARHVRAHPGQYLWLHRRWTKDLGGQP